MHLDHTTIAGEAKYLPRSLIKVRIDTESEALADQEKQESFLTFKDTKIDY